MVHFDAMKPPVHTASQRLSADAGPSVDRNCPLCGAELPQNAAGCTECGTDLADFQADGFRPSPTNTVRWIAAFALIAVTAGLAVALFAALFGHAEATGPNY